MRAALSRTRASVASCFLLAAPAALLVACASAESTRVNGPDGEPGWYSISCRHDMGACEEEAGNLCPHGYVTENESESDHPFLVSTYGSNGGYTVAGNRHRGHMLIKCRSRRADDE